MTDHISANQSRAADPAANLGIAPTAAPEAPATKEHSWLKSWLIDDIPYFAMLLLTLAGVVLRLPESYWLFLFPVFAIISIIEGRKRLTSRGEQLRSVLGVAMIWVATLAAIYILFNGGVKGVLNVAANSIVLTTLLALGTFCAGVHARVWQIGAIGVILFLSVPALGWLDQSYLLLTVGALFIVALGGVSWWYTSRTRDFAA